MNIENFLDDAHFIFYSNLILLIHKVSCDFKTLLSSYEIKDIKEHMKDF